MNTRFITRIYRSFLFASALASISLLSACGGDDPAVVNVNPTGYYTGDADVYDGDGMLVGIQDLQGLVDGNRFMAMSETQELLYDGTITSITGNDFSATVKVYKVGALVTGSVTTFSGKITEGLKITGTFGSGDWGGTFTLNYAVSNSEVAVSTNVATADKFWGGSNTNDDISTDPQFRVNASGALSSYNAIYGGVLLGCSTNSGGVTPIANTRFFRVEVVYITCGNDSGAVTVSGTYTGLATTKESNGKLVWMITKSDATNGDFANASDYVRRTVPVM